jgi:hypothetical protein
MIQTRTDERVQQDLILATGSRMNDPQLTRRFGAARWWQRTMGGGLTRALLQALRGTTARVS